MTSATGPIVTMAFCILILLIGLSGLDTSRQARQIYATLDSINEAASRNTRLLSDIQSGIYLSSIFLRDFLLDPSHITADMHRTQLAQVRNTITAQLAKLEATTREEEKRPLRRLHRELDSYWAVIDPVFDWTPRQKLSFSGIFLEKQILPRRTAVLEMAQQVADLNAADFEERKQKVDTRMRAFVRHTNLMLGIAVALGLVVAGVSILRITHLERRSGEQHRQTEMAERELRRLSHVLVQAQEEERRHISRELHDQVGQTLTALRMQLGNLERLGTASEPVFRAHLDDAKALAEQTLETVRNLAMGLRPSMLDDLGLGPALEWQAREFSRRTGIPAEVVLEQLPNELPESHRTCVYRVVQEALTNCARHANAKHVRIAVHCKKNCVYLTVQDDGAGLSRRPGVGLGLIGIQERVRELGGKVDIQSQPGRGTLLRAEIPV